MYKEINVTELENIYNMYFKDVFLYARVLTGNEHIAEDITSETFMKAIKSLDSFEGRCDIRVWLCQIAKNSYISYLRKNNDLLNINEIEKQADKVNTEQLVINMELMEEFRKAHNGLNEPYKRVFSLRFFSEMRFKDIAHIYGKTENWACVTYHRAKNDIRRLLEEYK